MRQGIEAVLFDLDGTLIDSAPDLAATVNAMLAKRALPGRPYDQLRCHAGSGARGMIGAAFAVGPGDDRYGALRDEFHDDYERRMLDSTLPFEHIEPVLDALERTGMRWGIVTNKALRFAEPVARAMRLWPRAAALVGGDSTAHTKPHPAPLLEGARRLGTAAAHCVYVGDDRRDIVAGRAAGMHTLAAAWGYLGTEARPQDWQADDVMHCPQALLKWLDLA